MPAFTERINKPGYGLITGHMDTNVIFGGRETPANKIAATMNASFHNSRNGERGFFNLYDMDTPLIDRNEEHSGNRLRFRAGGCINDVVAGASSIKWNKEYDSAADVPDTFRYRIRHSDCYDIFKLTELGNLPGVHNWARYGAKDSYAVYYNDGSWGNEVHSGKVLQIDSMYFVCEATGERSPLLPMEISPSLDHAKILTAIVSPEVRIWLEDPRRTARVFLDPFVGYNSEGALTFSADPNFIQWVHVSSATVTGPVNAIRGYFSTAGIGIRVGCADSNGPTGNPSNSTINAQGVTTNTLASGITDLSVNSALQLTSGVDYRVGYMSDGATYKYDNLTLRGIYQLNVGAPDYLNQLRSPIQSLTGPFATGITPSLWLENAAAIVIATPPHIFGQVL